MPNQTEGNVNFTSSNASDVKDRSGPEIADSVTPKTAT